MTEIKIKVKHSKKEFFCKLGESLKEILDRADLRVRSGCRNNGACGLCLVKILKGDAGPLSENESLHLDQNKIDNNLRLACEVFPTENLMVEIIATEKFFDWKDPNEKESVKYKIHAANSKEKPEQRQSSLGVAVDLGTTHINISLFDIASGKRLSERYTINPQIVLGSDIMTRLQFAKDNTNNAIELSRMVLKALAKGIWEMTTYLGLDTAQVKRVCIVGNTAMISLLSNRNYELLLNPKNWWGPIDCLPENSQALLYDLGLDEKTELKIIPPIAGFIGSDVIAGIIALKMLESPSKMIFVDFGTNTEVVLWDGNSLWITSASGGPAFEGSGISCGMPAEPGAICKVRNNTQLTFEYIEGAEVNGICGSGLVDLFAAMVENKRINSIGQFATDGSNKILFYNKNKVKMHIMKKDVDVFQRAKAAISASIAALLMKSGTSIGEIERLMIAGAFGQYLDIENAIAIGLLPDIQKERFELVGNAAHLGCEHFLMAKHHQNMLDSVLAKIKFINLSQFEDFENLFFVNLFLKKQDL